MACRTQDSKNLSPDEPVRISAPPHHKQLPVIYDSPHSGRRYPPDFLPAVPLEALRGYEDRLVDDLVQDAPKHGIVLIAATFPRAYIDPNRAIDDLDPQVVGSSWTDPLNPTEYSKLGLGLIFRTGLDDKPIYEQPLDRESVRKRIENYWRPYHQTLERALALAQERWGAVWHIAWHSMRPIGDAQSIDPGDKRPDFVISDRDNTSAEQDFTDFVADTLRELGYTVALNYPFKGGYITQRHGRPGEGRHSIQVEINRALYLDLETLQLAPRAPELRRDLDFLSQQLADFTAGRLGIDTAKES